MVYKTTSSKRVIGKVFRDFKPVHSEWVTDAIEWIGEALELIGSFAGTYKKSTGNEDSENEDTNGPITIENHRAKLPCDLESIFMVEYNGGRLPWGGDVTLPGLVCDDRTTDVEPNPDYQSSEVLAGNSQSVQLLNDDGTILSRTAVGSRNYDYYQTNPDYIITSFESGHIKIHYNAYYVDEYGYPLVPDHASVTTALSWYIIKMLLLQGHEHPTIRFDFAHQMWLDYCTQARSRIKFPSIDRADLFRRMWARIIPREWIAEDFFMGGENPERVSAI